MQPSHSIMNCTGNEIGSECVIICDDGYYLDQHESTQCGKLYSSVNY